MSASLLLEIGCEEIPARMIAGASAELMSRLLLALDQAGVAHGGAVSWGGTRRLAVRVDAVASRLEDKVETVLGPPATAAFGPDGTPTPAGAGFAKKQGVPPSALRKIETERGTYAGLSRGVAGRTLSQVLAAALPASVAAMPFPKAMRWGSGAHRWVRPVHWVVALHGEDVLELELLGVRSGRSSEGHRFLAPGPIALATADDYVEALRGAKVLADPDERRRVLVARLMEAAKSAGGTVIADEALLGENTDLVEWPGVVVGRFDPEFLDLPREILVTTLKHHQKAFSVEGKDGLLPAFLAVANTDRDPAGHVRRGNEWVVIGRLDDARFFWGEDRKRPLAARLPDLERVTFHVKVGSYAATSKATAELVERIAGAAGLSADERRRAVEAARLAKADLTTGLVGEFPELQGIVGGLLLRAERENGEVATAIYEHYRPTTAEDALPSTMVGCAVGLADRLTTIGALLAAGEMPTGSRDPFGLRRAINGAFRIVLDQRWPLSIEALATLLTPRGVTPPSTVAQNFVVERIQNFFRERGATQNEINAVLQPSVSTTASMGWSLDEIHKRLEVVGTLRGRDDFRILVELTKRVDNILAKQPEVLKPALQSDVSFNFKESAREALLLDELHESLRHRISEASEKSDFKSVVDLMSRFAPVVEAFFDKVLVLDRDNPNATWSRCDLLARLRSTLTRDFDIRELAGQADAKR